VPADTRKNSTPEDNHDRWLVSYADFVTLLFAFFVVLFASSTVDQAKLQSFAARFEQYVRRNPAATALLEGGATAFSAPQPLTADVPALSAEELQDSIARLRRELFPEIREGKIELSVQPRGLVMSLRESAFFAPGEAELQPRSRETLAKVAAALTRIPGQIRMEGHTDDTPIQTRRFPSNWELSTARAISVLRLLANDYGLAAQRLGVAGYGEFFPLVPNDSAENRAKNRRVDVVILTEQAADLEPPAGGLTARTP
jgi:chemotaxis protein MotB